LALSSRATVLHDVELVEDLPLLDEASLDERAVGHDSIDARTHLDAAVWLDLADEFVGFGDAGRRHGDHANLSRGRNEALLRGLSAAASRDGGQRKRTKRDRALE
jgi:hypothetical protein